MQLHDLEVNTHDRLLGYELGAKCTISMYDGNVLRYGNEWVIGMQQFRLLGYRHTCFANNWLSSVFATDFPVKTKTKPLNTMPYGLV